MRKRIDLTLALRMKLKEGILDGLTGGQIGLLLGVNPVTVYREVRKNGGLSIYDPKVAHAAAQARRRILGNMKQKTINANSEISELRDKVYALQQQVDILFELIKEG